MTGFSQNSDPQRFRRLLRDGSPRLAAKQVKRRASEIAWSAALVVALAAALVLGQSPGTQATSTATGVQFTSVDVFVDSKDKPLAAYQVEIWDTRHAMKIVGIEGGEHAAFKEPPRYDPAAMQNDRVVLAAFNTGSNLPVGRTRVARLHVAIGGSATPQYHEKIVVAAAPDGEKIAAQISLSHGDGP